MKGVFAGPFTVFADDHLGAWVFHTIDDIVTMEREVLQLFQVLSAAGLQVSPSKSKFIIQVQGAEAERYLAQRTVLLHGKPHFRFGEGDEMVAVPVVKEFVYLGTVVTLGKQSDRTISHRLEEARKREGQLRKSIRSRSVLRSGTRVAIWRACVVASALYGLLAQELTAANVTTLRQWYHRSLRAVTGMPAHLTHISNADLRTKFGLKEPLEALLRLTQNKLRRIAALPDGHAATLQATVEHWRRCEQNLAIFCCRRCTESPAPTVGSISSTPRQCDNTRLANMGSIGKSLYRLRMILHSTRPKACLSVGVVKKMRLPSGPKISHHAQFVWLVPNSGHRGT